MDVILRSAQTPLRSLVPASRPFARSFLNHPRRPLRKTDKTPARLSQRQFSRLLASRQQAATAVKEAPAVSQSSHTAKSLKQNARETPEPDRSDSKTTSNTLPQDLNRSISQLLDFTRQPVNVSRTRDRNGVPEKLIRSYDKVGVLPRLQNQYPESIIATKWDTMLMPERMAPSTADALPTLRHPTPVSMHVPYMSLGPSAGRTVKLGEGRRALDLGTAFRILESKCKRNNVKSDFNSQKYHERPGRARKRLKSARWRKRFKDSFVATVDRILELRQKGW